MWKIVILILGFIFFIYSFYIEPNRVEISKITIRIKGLSDALNGFSIIHLSDLHLTNIGKKENKLLEVVNGLNADILVITGDFVNRRDAIDDCIQLINKFKTKYGKWGAWGNYDHAILNSADRKRLAESDIVILNNENQSIAVTPVPAHRCRVNQQNIWIIGVDDPFTGRDDLLQAISGVPEEDFKILLAHSPAIVEEASKYGINLVLAGHTHGGQVYIPLLSHLVVCLLGGKEYISGKYKVGQTYLYVTRGIGTSILPLRAFCPPEITLIKLMKDEPV